MTRRLYRSRTDTMIGGVAAGLATYLNVDPVLVRVAWVVGAIVTNGAGVLAYLVAWVVIPEEPLGAPRADRPAGDEDSASVAASADDSAVEPWADSGRAAMTGDEFRPVASPRSDGRAGLIVGIGLVLLGVWFLVREYLPPIDWSLLWPIVLIGIGGVVLLTSSRRRA